VEKLAITIDEMGEMLQICRSKAYSLAAIENFPRIKIGRSIRIPLQPLRDWLEKQAAQGGEVCE